MSDPSEVWRKVMGDGNPPHGWDPFNGPRADLEVMRHVIACWARHRRDAFVSRLHDRWMLRWQGQEGVPVWARYAVGDYARVAVSLAPDATYAPNPTLSPEQLLSLVKSSRGPVEVVVNVGGLSFHAVVDSALVEPETPPC